MSDNTTLLDHPVVAQRYFYPRVAAFPEPYWIEAADGSRLACSYHTVNSEAPTVVYFHGNGEVVADCLPDFPAWFGQAGYNLLLAEYRGYGMSTGSPALAGMLDDVSAIVQHLALPDAKMVLFGRSIGSLYALHGVLCHPWIAGLILESGIADLTERFFQRIDPAELGQSRATLVMALQAAFDSTQQLAAFQGRTLILHTRFDELVSVDHAERLYAAAAEPKQLHIFPQGGHNDIFSRNRQEYTGLVESFLRALW